MKKQIQILVFFALIIAFINCTPDWWLPDQRYDVLAFHQNDTTQQQYTNWKGIPELSSFACFAPFSCNPNDGCRYSVNEMENIMKNKFAWNQSLPSQAAVTFMRGGFILRFRWQSKQTSFIPFRSGQAWLVKFDMQDRNFIRKVRFVAADFPCYFWYLTPSSPQKKSEFENQLKDNCRIPLDISKSLGLYLMKRVVASYTRPKGFFKQSIIVGTFCPEQIKPDELYTIAISFEQNRYSTTTMVKISSELLEDTVYLLHKKNQKFYQQKISDCDLLIQNIDIQVGNKRYICGRFDRKVWINRLCTPTNNYIFIPGVDIYNTDKRKAYCFNEPKPGYDLGDNDKWIDKRREAFDLAGNRFPITNNMILYSTFVGDCQNNYTSNTYNTEKCGWYNIGQISPERQCYWNDEDENAENLCFFDKHKKIKFFPENFVKEYYKQSKKYNFHAGSFDRLGYPQSWVRQYGFGLIQIFNHGAIGEGALMMSLRNNPLGRVYYLGGLFWNLYSTRIRNAVNVLGYPISDRIKQKFYYEQRFEFGWMRQYLNDTNCAFVKIQEYPAAKMCYRCRDKNDCMQFNAKCVKGYCMSP